MSMRKLLLASAGVLALTAGAAFADSHGGIDVSVPVVKNAVGVNGSNAATAGSTAGNNNGNSLSASVKNASASPGSNAATTGGLAGNGSGNSSSSSSSSLNKTATNSFNRSESVSKTLSATSGGSGGSASATSGGLAVNKSNSDNKAFALLGMAVSNGNLTATKTDITTTYTFGNSDTRDSVSGNHIGGGSGGGMADSWKSGTSPAGSGAITMTGSMGGLGILTAQQNTGAAALQQNSPVLTSIVGSGTGAGIGH
jgi:hypothetical protein